MPVSKMPKNTLRFQLKTLVFFKISTKSDNICLPLNS